MKEQTTKQVVSPSVIQMRLNTKQYPRIKSLPYQDAVKQLAALVGTAFMYTGRPSKEEDIAFIATNLYNEIMMDEENIGMRNISIAEIGRCIKRSVLGQGKEMFGISVASLYAIVADYCKGEGHLACKEIERMDWEQRQRALKSSSVGVLLDVAAGALVKQSKL